MLARSRILCVLYDGFELLDMAGPLSVFAAANAVCGALVYETRTLSPKGGKVGSYAGPEVDSDGLEAVAISRRDTVIVVGAEGRDLRRAMSDGALRVWLRSAARKAMRYGSVCTGAFVLAAAGLLDGRRAATHWGARRELSAKFPEVSVDPEALYVADGKLWTSAGVTTGIDMALSMVATDLGRDIATQVAKRLVVYAHRPGGQSQFSAMLDAQSHAGAAFANLLPWIDSHLDMPIRVADMAREAGMTERTFFRKFTKAVGTTPSKFLEKTRLSRARLLLEDGQAVKSVAAAVGFRSEAGFRTAFEAAYGVPPSLHRRMHGGG